MNDAFLKALVSVAGIAVIAYALVTRSLLFGLLLLVLLVALYLLYRLVEAVEAVAAAIDRQGRSPGGNPRTETRRSGRTTATDPDDRPPVEERSTDELFE